MERRQPLLQQKGKSSAGAQSQQRKRNREKCEVIKEHHGEQSSERQLQQQCRKTGEPQTYEKRALGNLGGRRNRRGSLNSRRHDETECASLAEDRQSAVFPGLVFENDLRDGLLRGVRKRQCGILHAQLGGKLAGLSVKSDGRTSARHAYDFAIPPAYTVAPACA